VGSVSRPAHCVCPTARREKLVPFNRKRPIRNAMAEEAIALRIGRGLRLEHATIFRRPVVTCGSG